MDRPRSCFERAVEHKSHRRSRAVARQIPTPRSGCASLVWALLAFHLLCDLRTGHSISDHVSPNNLERRSHRLSSADLSYARRRLVTVISSRNSQDDEVNTLFTIKAGIIRKVGVSHDTKVPKRHREILNPCCQVLDFEARSEKERMYSRLPQRGFHQWTQLYFFYSTTRQHTGYSSDLYPLNPTQHMNAREFMYFVTKLEANWYFSAQHSK